MKLEYKWKFVGSGNKAHAVREPCGALCGQAGETSDTKVCLEAETAEKCARCLRKLANEARAAELDKIKGLIESGYAGVLSNGNIVDRREYPRAIPIPKNAMFNTPDPKPL